MEEFDIIAKHFAPLAIGEPGALGLTDDAALLNVRANNQLVITSDCLIAGVHFFPSDPPQTIARKALGVNLSDLAAMGAKPRAYTFAVAWPKTIDDHWISQFAGGLKSAQTEWGVTLIGGDTVATKGPLTLTISAFGEVNHGKALKRSGAEPGDDLYVSGTIGDAALGLTILSAATETNEGDQYLIDRYRCPQPRLTLGPKLLGIATSAMDISDGLVADMMHLAETSNVSAVIDTSLVPLSGPGQHIVDQKQEAMNTVLCGGDDYELLFTAPPSCREEIQAVSRQLKLNLTLIGTIENHDGVSHVRIVDQDGNQFELSGNSGYRHF